MPRIIKLGVNTIDTIKFSQQGTGPECLDSNFISMDSVDSQKEETLDLAKIDTILHNNERIKDEINILLRKSMIEFRDLRNSLTDRELLLSWTVVIGLDLGGMRAQLTNSLFIIEK